MDLGSSHVTLYRLHQRLQKAFDKSRTRNAKLVMGYDEFVALVGNNELSQTDISLKLGVTRQLISLLYQTYVAPLENNTRRPYAGRRYRKERMTAKMMAVPILAAAAHKAIEAGFRVEPVVGGYNNFIRRQIRVNGKLCGVRAAHKPHVTNRMSVTVYASFHVNVRKFQHLDAVILLSHIPDYLSREYVVPMSVFNTLAAGRKSVQVYLPLDHYPKWNYGIPNVNWWLYENAWHHLA